jgi:small subunit ribosomal protein S20
MKRLRQDKKRRVRNRAVKSELKSVSKRVLEAGRGEDRQKLLSRAESVIDRAAKKRVIHWKNAARKKSRLAKRAETAAS